MPDQPGVTTSYYLQQRPAGTDEPWQRAIGINASWRDRATADDRLAGAREMRPDREHRLITRTTAVTDTPTESAASVDLAALSVPADPPECDCEAEVHMGVGFYHQPQCATRNSQPTSRSDRAPDCLFCHPGSDTNQILATTPTCYARLDNFPAAPGHAEVIPYRHAESFLDLTPAEVADVHTLLRELADQGGADGWTIGVNEGQAAGRTIDHVHIHLIPRRHGDVPDPRGGVRNVLPGGNPDDWAAASGSGRVADETQAERSRCSSREPLIGYQCSKEAGHEVHSDRPGRIWYPVTEDEAQKSETRAPRMLRSRFTILPGTATVASDMCPRCKGDNSEAWALCANCAEHPAAVSQPEADLAGRYGDDHSCAEFGCSGEPTAVVSQPDGEA